VYFSTDINAARQNWRRELVIDRMRGVDSKGQRWAWKAVTFQNCAIVVSLNGGYCVMSRDPNSRSWSVRQSDSYEFLDLEVMNDQCMFALVKSKKVGTDSFSLELWHTKSVDAEWSRQVLVVQLSGNPSAYLPNLACGNGIVAVQYYHDNKPWLIYTQASVFTK
jgi:hypothetical protein